jgi:hypothetical protein
MTNSRRLARLSAAQLAVGVAGLAVALARRRNADVGFLRGDPVSSGC